MLDAPREKPLLAHEVRLWPELPLRPFKSVQSMARHCDINLTMNTYTMRGVMDTAAAVQTLPAAPGAAIAVRAAAS